MIGKGTDAADPDAKKIISVSKVFAGNCPLWTYILAEAMHHKESVKIPVKEKVTITTPKLGPVGGRIVAEVFLGLMFGDTNSMLRLEPKWKPKTAQLRAEGFRELRAWQVNLMNRRNLTSRRRLRHGRPDRRIAPGVCR